MKQGLRKAGGLFGLDLFKLFEDSEGSEQGDFDPALSFSTTSKGRGGLTYLPQPQSAVTTTLALLPRSQQVQAPSDLAQPQLPSPQTAEPVEASNQKSLQDIARDYGQTALFGHQDYKKATQDYGYSNQDIQNYLESNPYMLAVSNRAGQGGLMDEVLRGRVDTTKATTREFAEAQRAFTPTAGSQQTQAFRNAQSYSGAPEISTQFGQDANYFGKEDLAAARQSGYSDENIKSFLQKNLDSLRGPNVPGGESEIGQLTAGMKNKEPREPGVFRPIPENAMVTPVNRGTLGPAAAAASSGASIGAASSSLEPENIVRNAPEIRLSAGQSAEYFGHKDVEAAKAAGASNKQIAKYISRNPSRLRGGNVEGGGGLYDEYAKYM